MSDRITPGRYRPPDFSDAGNMEVFTHYHQQDLIYTDALGWMWWNGTVWESGEHKALALAVDLSEKMLAEAEKDLTEALVAQAQTKAAHNMSHATDADMMEASQVAAAAKEYAKHARATRNANRLTNLLELSKPRLVVPLDRLDADRDILNTPAGIVDLTTGKIRPHDPAAYCSSITQTAPGDKGREKWQAFLHDVTGGNKDIENFLQLSSGAEAFGTVYHEGITIAVGGGRNGKSTFFNVKSAVLGSYAGAIDVKTLTTDKSNQGAALATLRGKRLVVTGELEEHQRLSVSMLKRIASTDRLVIERKYKDPEAVTPSHSLVLFTNHLPRVGSTDEGTWRRLTVIPFNATIEKKREIPNYAEVLAREAGPAILEWIIQGAVIFARNGYRLTIPQVIADATASYREREDWLTNFISEKCVRGQDARIGAADLYRVYRAWAEETGDYVRRLNDFTTAMESAGFKKIAPRNRKMWLGLTLESCAKIGTLRAV